MTATTREFNSSARRSSQKTSSPRPARLCRDDRIVVAGAERGTVSSSLILAGEEIVLYHIEGDPRGREYQEFRLLIKIEIAIAPIIQVSTP